MSAIKNKTGLFFIVFLSALPLIFWASLKPISERFSSFPIALTSLGQIAGLTGMALFALALILSSRLKFFEDYFGGLDKLYFTHKTAGIAAFVFLLFHPLFLAGSYFFVSAREAALFLLPSDNWTLNFGIFSLLLMILLVILIFFVKLPYQVWKFSHKFMGLSFFLAGLHAFLVPSDISRAMPLKIYMFSLSFTGLVFYFYRAVLGKFLVKKTEYEVKSVRLLGGQIMEIEMLPKNQPIEFLSGQFVFVQFFQKGISREVHPFSIGSSPKNQTLKIAVKILGDYTAQLKNLKSGALAKVEGPFGKFFSRGLSDKKQIWIAGGIGITPFLSKARAGDFDREIDLYYCVNDEKEAVFLGELLEISKNSNYFKAAPFFSSDRGFLTASLVEKSSGLKGKDIFLCGPPLMMRNLKKQFKELGVPGENIHSEEFQLA